MRHRLALALGLFLAGAGALPASASATELLDTTLVAERAVNQPCHTGLRAGQPGVVTREAVAPAQGVIFARLNAAAGDWDVAVFDKQTGFPLAGAAGFDAQEVAEGVVGAGGRTVVLQACRRSGDARSAKVSLVNVALPEPSADQRQASLVDVKTPTRADKARLQALDLDLTEHGGDDFVEVVLYGAADEAKLEAAGFAWDVEVPDVVALARQNAEENRRYMQRAASPLPSGRDAYRRLADFENELKELAQQNPGLVRPITLKNKTVEDRDVNGVEITTNVNDLGDGKPVFFNMGIHHAREWPSGEHAMEFAYDLVRNFGKDPRITGLVEKTRTIIVPVINPDGFNVSREAPIAIDQAGLLFDTNNDQIPDPANFGIGGLDLGYTAAILGDPAGAYKRKNCRLVDNQKQPQPICRAPQFRQFGTDPNRNYGGLWGGDGATFFPNGETYRGAGPFSEFETQNVRDLVSKRHVTTLITNHTFSNLVLRPPGVRAQGPPPDEPVYADLGRRMTEQNGYANNPSYQLYDTTGGTEDWTYYATGGLGFTFEIGPDQFHPPYEDVVKEYLGGSKSKPDGKGNREAYLIALENTADQAKHSVLTGQAPKGTVLKLQKKFITETEPVKLATGPGVLASEPDKDAPRGDKRFFEDVLDTSFTPDGGRFEWNINPSTRPIVETKTFPGTIADQPSRKDEFSGSATDGDVVDKEFTVTEEDRATILDVKFDSQLNDDYDIELYLRKGSELEKVGNSGNFAPDDPADPTGPNERVTLDAPPIGTYVLRVINYAAVGPWSATVERFPTGPNKVVVGKKETWTLRCETADGKLLTEQRILVDRGQTLDAGQVCGADAPQILAMQSSNRRAAAVCAGASGFASASAKARGRSVALSFRRLVPEPVTVDVFQASSGRQIFGERRVARFSNKTRSFTWDGRTTTGKQVRDGLFFARFRIKGAKRLDFRRVTLQRSGGRFKVVPQFYRPDTCGLLSSAKLERPAFGGRTNRPLNIAYRVSRRSDVTVTVKRGTRVVRTIRSRGRAARRTHRLRVPAERLRGRGAYKVTISVLSGGRRASATLTARRL